MNKRNLCTITAVVVLLSGCASAPYHATRYDNGYATHNNATYSSARDCRHVPVNGTTYTPEIAGAIVGGVLGNQIGSGSGRDVATVAGAVLGGSLGHDYKNRYRKNYRVVCR